MGSRMARRLVDTGYEVLVWNRSPERVAPLLRKGAAAAESPREAAERADVLITMLADPDALQAVTEGDDGIAAGAHPGVTVIEMSTVGDVLRQTPLADQAKRRLRAIEAADYPPRFPLSLARKDAELIHDAGPGLRLVEATRSWLADAEAAGRGGQDYTAVLETILDGGRE